MPGGITALGLISEKELRSVVGKCTYCGCCRFPRKLDAPSFLPNQRTHCHSIEFEPNCSFSRPDSKWCRSSTMPHWRLTDLTLN